MLPAIKSFVSSYGYFKSIHVSIQLLLVSVRPLLQEDVADPPALRDLRRLPKFYRK